MTKVKELPRASFRTSRPLPRRQLHRAFLRWLKLNRARFAIGIQLGSRTDQKLKFSFVGINPAITGILSTSDVNVNVIFEDNDLDAGNWDTLIWLFHGAKRIPGGYICSECKPEYKRVFPDLVALWTDHLFEALLKWVNEDLAPANWLILNDKVQAFTSAWLASLRPDTTGAPDCVWAVLPLRTQPRKQPDPSPSAITPSLGISESKQLNEDSNDLERMYQQVKQYGVTMEELRAFNKISKTPPQPYKDDPDAEFVEI